MIYETVCKNRLEKRGVCNVSYSMLTLIMSEVDTIFLRGGKKTKDEICTDVVKKMLKDVTATEQLLKTNNRPYDQDAMNIEIDLLTSLLPKKLSEDKIKLIIASNDLKTNKDAQMYFKQHYSGQYDGAMIVKALGEVWL